MEWFDPSDRLPDDGQVVRVRLVGGRVIKAVEYAAGRFWKFRRGTSGHCYNVDAWSAIEMHKRSRPDDVGTKENTD